MVPVTTARVASAQDVRLSVKVVVQDGVNVVTGITKALVVLFARLMFTTNVLAKDGEVKSIDSMYTAVPFAANARELLSASAARLIKVRRGRYIGGSAPLATADIRDKLWRYRLTRHFTSSLLHSVHRALAALALQRDYLGLWHY